MANTSRKGFWPLRYANGSPWNGAVTKYVIKSGHDTSVGVGDAVSLLGSGSADGLYANIQRMAATSEAILGVVVGFGPNLANDRFIPGKNLWTDQAADRIAYVVDDPNVLFIGECTTAVTATDIGLNSFATVTAPSSTTGLSTEVLSTPAADVNGHFLVVGLLDTPDNEAGVASNKVIVRMNRSPFRAAVAGA